MVCVTCQPRHHVIVGGHREPQRQREEQILSWGERVGEEGKLEASLNLIFSQRTKEH